MRIFVSIALAMLVVIPINAQTGIKNFIDQPYIEVTGKSEMEITPDLIYLKVIINEEDNKGKVSLENMEQEMMKTLKQIGVDTEKEVAIIDFASNFQSHILKKKDILTSKEYQVIVHNGNMAAKVYFELEKLDISNISVTKLDHSKMEDFRRQVKNEAVKAAKGKAVAMCDAIGEKAGKAIYIQEINRGYYPGKMRIMESNTMIKVKGEGISKAKELDIEFQKLKLEYEVMARFIIE